MSFINGLRTYFKRRAQPGVPGAPEFEALSEAQRVDYVFALAVLDEQASAKLLARALDDPCETVALAAARALTIAGRTAEVERYLAARPGERARSIARMLELLS